MKIQIRSKVWETNSSSVHTLVMCNDDTYNAWKRGEYVFDSCKDCLVKITDENRQEIENDNIEGPNKEYFTYNTFMNHFPDYEVYNKTYTSDHGDLVHAFGYYGLES